MSALTFNQRLVANIAAAPFGRVNAARLLRNSLKAGLKVVVLVAAAQQVDDKWLSIALVVLAVLIVAPFLLIGIAQRALDERHARLALLSDSGRTVLKDKTRLYGEVTS